MGRIGIIDSRSGHGFRYDAGVMHTHPTESIFSRPRLRSGLQLILGVAAIFFVSGCVDAFWSGNREKHHASSVVGYLYPDQDNPLPPPGLPVLRLPLKVGVAFVPSGTRRNPGFAAAEGLSDKQKADLLQRVADEFKGREYIRSIELVPSSFLRPGGGFDNLNQVRSLLGVDVVVLVAFDQVQFSDSNFLSLSYWTIVGAYIFKGEKNDTQTLMEADVYDIASRHLLFRAAGASAVQGSSAAVYNSENLRADSAKGFELGTVDLIHNLKTQLEGFRDQLKSAPNTVAQIEREPGYTGGGAMGGGFCGLLALLVAVRRPWRKK